MVNRDTMSAALRGALILYIESFYTVSIILNSFSRQYLTESTMFLNSIPIERNFV